MDDLKLKKDRDIEELVEASSRAIFYNAFSLASCLTGKPNPLGTREEYLEKMRKQKKMKNELTESQAEQLDYIFTYQPATEEDLAAYAAINEASKNLARVILEVCPRSADRTDAIRQVRKTRMIANASIACRGRAMPDGC